LVVAETGIRLVWRNAWLKRILMFMVVPALVVGAFVAAFEQSVERSDARDAMRWLMRSPAGQRAVERAGIDSSHAIAEPATARHFAWSYLLFILFRYPQSFGMILVLGLVAPRLISYDLRSKGYLLYLSRPLTPAEYVAGKAGVIFFLLFMMAAVPSLLIYVAGLFLSTDTLAISHTWDLPLRIVLASAVLMIPTTAVALAMSSLTQESRYAGFAWFAFWVIGVVSYQILWFAAQARQGIDPERMEFLGEYNPWMLVSPYDTLGYLQMQIFGLTQGDAWVWAPWIVAVAASVLGYGIAYWRVARMLKA
jgi:ABC-type transport system involved in multi-copper enzyme maturation permease subunit